MTQGTSRHWLPAWTPQMQVRTCTSLIGLHGTTCGTPAQQTNVHTSVHCAARQTFKQVAWGHVSHNSCTAHGSLQAAAQCFSHCPFVRHARPPPLCCSRQLAAGMHSINAWGSGDEVPNPETLTPVWLGRSGWPARGCHFHTWHGCIQFFNSFQIYSIWHRHLLLLQRAGTSPSRGPSRVQRAAGRAT